MAGNASGRDPAAGSWDDRWGEAELPCQTARGVSAALVLTSRRHAAQVLAQDILGIDEDQAKMEAERLERHALGGLERQMEQQRRGRQARERSPCRRATTPMRRRSLMRRQAPDWVAARAERRRARLRGRRTWISRATT
jgi:hypothetical protein